MVTEEVIGVVKAYVVGGEGLVLTVIKEARERLKIKPHEKFYIKIDGEDRIIYERIREAGTHRL